MSRSQLCRHPAPPFIPTELPQDPKFSKSETRRGPSRPNIFQVRRRGGGSPASRKLSKSKTPNNIGFFLHQIWTSQQISQQGGGSLWVTCHRQTHTDNTSRLRATKKHICLQLQPDHVAGAVIHRTRCRNFCEYSHISIKSTVTIKAKTMGSFLKL